MNMTQIKYISKQAQRFTLIFLYFLIVCFIVVAVFIPIITTNIMYSEFYITVDDSNTYITGIKAYPLHNKTVNSLSVCDDGIFRFNLIDITTNDYRSWHLLDSSTNKLIAEYESFYYYVDIELITVGDYLVTAFDKNGVYIGAIMFSIKDLSDNSTNIANSMFIIILQTSMIILPISGSTWLILSLIIYGDKHGKIFNKR